MLPILLAVSAAGAVLELKRFVHRGGSSEAEIDDVQVEQEDKLKEMLQVDPDEHTDCFAGAASCRQPAVQVDALLGMLLLP